jgi:hypothetical protein
MKAMRNLSQDSRCSGLNSNLALPEYKSNFCRLSQFARLGKMWREVIITGFKVPYQILIGELRKTKEHVNHDNQSQELGC